MAADSAEYRLSHKATQDMEGIWRYIFEAWGIEQANDYIDRMIAALGELAEHPQRGQSVEHIRRNYRRTLVGRHVVYYTITGYGIAVI